MWPRALALARAGKSAAVSPDGMENARLFICLLIYLAAHAAVALAFPLRNAARAPPGNEWKMERNAVYLCERFSFGAHNRSQKQHSCDMHIQQNAARPEWSGAADSDERVVCVHASMCVRADKFE